MTPIRSPRSLTLVSSAAPTSPPPGSRRRRGPRPAANGRRARTGNRHRRRIHRRRQHVLGRRGRADRQAGHGQRRQHQEADARRRNSRRKSRSGTAPPRRSRARPAWRPADGRRRNEPQAKTPVANSTSHGTRLAKNVGGVASSRPAPRTPPARLIPNSAANDSRGVPDASRRPA